jgi:superfamily II DNA or RNA helicase
MQLIIDSSLRLLNVPRDITSWFIEQLTFSNPKFEEAMRYGRYVNNIDPHIKLYKELPNGLTLPRGYLQIVEDSIIGQGLNVSIKDNRILAPPITVASNIKLRPYQRNAKFDLLSHPNGMLVAPAGSGKTIMGLDIFDSVRQPLLWLTHTNRLSNQVIERILEIFTDVTKSEIGFIGAGKVKLGNRITIGMIPTLVRREIDLISIGKKFGIVIVDEAHHVPASTFLKVVGYFSSYYLYGLTATPYRRDKMEDIMFATMGLPNAKVNRKEVKKKGDIITPIVVKRIIPSEIWENNDFSYIVREILLNNDRRLYTIVQDVLKEAIDGNYCIVVSTRKQYCEMILEKLVINWNKTVIATGDYSRKHNDEQVAKIENGEATVLITTFELLGEGFDVPKLNRCFLALPFRERARVEQTVGRIQRPCEGKRDAVIYDYVDENIGILKNQFLHRAMTYRLLGMKIIN